MTASGALANECCCGPSDDCDWSLSPQSLGFDCVAQAGAFNVNVLTGSGCGWSASVTSGGAYLSINSGSSASSSSTVGFDLLSNSGAERTGQITVVTTVASPLGPAGTVIGVFNLTQSECGGNPIVPGVPPPSGDDFRWSISSGSATFDCPNQNGFFNVNTQLGGGWAASVISGGSFITIFAGSTGSDAGTVQFNIDSNPGAERGGQIEIITTIISDFGPAGTVIGYFSIAQMAASACGSSGSGALPCNWEVQPQSYDVDVPCEVEEGRSDVTTGAGCSWSASVISGGSFITITSGSSGLSSGTIVYDIAANTTSSTRTGTIRVVTGTASVYGPIGSLIQDIQISQKRGDEFLVIADAGFIQEFPHPVVCQGVAMLSPVPVWDGIITQNGPTTWDSIPFGSWNGFQFKIDGPGDNGYVAIIKDAPVAGQWLLGFNIQPGGYENTYVKIGGTSPAGVYNALSSCPSNPASVTVECSG